MTLVTSEDASPGVYSSGWVSLWTRQLTRALMIETVHRTEAVQMTLRYRLDIRVAAAGAVVFFSN
jgi:hypothetical protein